jgi:hypothetical protein
VRDALRRLPHSHRRHGHMRRYELRRHVHDCGVHRLPHDQPHGVRGYHDGPEQLRRLRHAVQRVNQLRERYLHRARRRHRVRGRQEGGAIPRTSVTLNAGAA